MSRRSEVSTKMHRHLFSPPFMRDLASPSWKPSPAVAPLLRAIRAHYPKLPGRPPGISIRKMQIPLYRESMPSSLTAGTVIL